MTENVETVTPQPRIQHYVNIQEIYSGAITGNPVMSLCGNAVWVPKGPSDNICPDCDALYWSNRPSSTK